MVSNVCPTVSPVHVCYYELQALLATAMAALPAKLARSPQWVVTVWNARLAPSQMLVGWPAAWFCSRLVTLAPGITSTFAWVTTQRKQRHNYATRTYVITAIHFSPSGSSSDALLVHLFTGLVSLSLPRLPCTAQRAWTSAFLLLQATRSAFRARWALTLACLAPKFALSGKQRVKMTKPASALVVLPWLATPTSFLRVDSMLPERCLLSGAV